MRGRALVRLRDLPRFDRRPDVFDLSAALERPDERDRDARDERDRGARDERDRDARDFCADFLTVCFCRPTVRLDPVAHFDLVDIRLLPEVLALTLERFVFERFLETDLFAPLLADLRLLDALLFDFKPLLFFCAEPVRLLLAIA